jgi:hypothetical protein
MKDYLPLVGTVVGALLSLTAVWLTQRGTAQRELAKLEHERT